MIIQRVKVIIRYVDDEGQVQNDWERVIAYQKQAKDEKDEVEVSDLARLGPAVADNQVVASVDYLSELQVTFSFLDLLYEFL